MPLEWCAAVRGFRVELDVLVPNIRTQDRSEYREKFRVPHEFVEHRIDAVRRLDAANTGSFAGVFGFQIKDIIAAGELARAFEQRIDYVAKALDFGTVQQIRNHEVTQVAVLIAVSLQDGLFHGRWHRNAANGVVIDEPGNKPRRLGLLDELAQELGADLSSMQGAG